MKIFIILVILGVLAYIFVFKDMIYNQMEKSDNAVKNAPARNVGGWGGVATGIDQTIDYGTGKTQVTALQRSKTTLKKLAIGEAVKGFEAATGRRPTSIADLVKKGYLKQDQTRDKYRRELLSGTKNGKFYVRSLGRDGKANTRDDWVKYF